ncbi:hypothetical protein [Streptomyces sp. NPDC051098]|uniref:hypothetical protein n=1 Tax=Streptomyces sp. NPDC051098 TaxID=3155411 RepID=UPI003433F5DA
MANLVVSNVPVPQTGVASGMNANFRTIGAAIGAAGWATVVTSTLQPNGLPRESGCTAGFLVLMVTSVPAFAVALTVPAVRRATHSGRSVTAAGLPHRLTVTAQGTRTRERLPKSLAESDTLGFLAATSAAPTAGGRLRRGQRRPPVGAGSEGTCLSRP